MFKRIMAPGDLLHLGILERALKVTAEEARHHGASLHHRSLAHVQGNFPRSSERRALARRSFLSTAGGQDIVSPAVCCRLL